MQIKKKVYLRLCSALLIIISFASLAWGAKVVKKKAPKPLPPVAKTTANATMRDFFWKRSWPQMEELYKSAVQKTPQDHSLMANAYRFQERWQEAVKILEANSKNFPASIKPYADMTLMLGYENLKRTRDALAVSERLWKSTPADLKYYVALAQYRLYNSQHDSRNSENALLRMLGQAGTNDKKIYTLTRLVSLENNKNKIEHALKLLELNPSNKEAAEALAKHKTPWPNNVRVALGVYSHLTGNSKVALERLNSATGRKAIYYRAWSLSRLKQNKDALNLWGGLAISGNAYAAGSVTRIANLAKDNGMKESCMKVLERIAKERKGNVQARALQSLAGLLGKDQAKRKEAIESQILKSFPNTNYAFNVLWRRGWANLNAGNAAEAARIWKQTDAPGVNAYKRARILYWLAYAQRQAGQKSEAEKTLALLKRKYPLTIYGLLTNQQLRILDGTNPALALKPSELEEWGFIYNAYLKLSGPKASTRELYRALSLSKWLGLDESYSEARRLETLMTSSTTLYRSDLEALYPRPFKTQVDNAARTYGVESSFIWSIMRQESAFKPDARSYVGAAGLMQLMPGTAKDESKRAGLAKYDLYNPSDNIKLGASHLSWLSKSFSRKEWIMAAYNAGSGNARKWMRDGGDRLKLDRWIEAIKFEETCGYVQRVSANLEIYRMLYDKK